MRASRLLLFKYSKLQIRLTDERTVSTKLNELCEDLRAKSRIDREAADVRYQELAQKRMDDMETAMVVERNLRDRLDEMEREWK